VINPPSTDEGTEIFERMGVENSMFRLP